MADPERSEGQERPTTNPLEDVTVRVTIVNRRLLNGGRSRGRTLFAAAAAVSLISVFTLTVRPSAARAAAAGTATIGQATCTVGDSTQPSILDLRLAGQTDGLPSTAVELLSYVHPGSICEMSASFETPDTALALATALPPGGGIGGGCQTTAGGPCDGEYYGTPNYDLHNCGGDATFPSGEYCIAEFDQIQFSFGFFSDGITYISGESVEAQNTSPDAASATWQGLSVNYSNSDGASVSSAYDPESGNGDGPGWRFSAANFFGEHDKDKGLCWVPGGQPTCIVSMLGYRVHVGQIGNFTLLGTSQNYCSLADFAPYLGQVTFATGDCVSP